MPPSYRVRLTRRAAGHLQDIFEFIENDSPQNARQMILRIMDAIDGLEILPHRHNVVSNTGIVGDEVRTMPVRPFLVRYHVDDANGVVTILGIRHGARRPE